MPDTISLTVAPFRVTISPTSGMELFRDDAPMPRVKTPELIEALVREIVRLKGTTP
jgi:hypothetical protein